MDVAEIVKIEWRYDNENSSARSLEVSYEKNNPKYKGIYSVFDWMHFFNYLRNNNYVSVLTMADKPKDGKYNFSINDDDIRISQDKWRERHPNEIDCENIGNIEICELKDLWCECIYPRPLLGELVARDFKTQEQIQFTKQINKTNCALVVSIAALVVSITVEIYSICKNNDAKINPQQHKELINAIESTSIDTTQTKIINLFPQEQVLKKPPKGGLQ